MIESDGEVERLRAEVAALKTRLSGRRAIRRRTSYLLVVISALLVVASTVALWTYRTALDTDGFMATVEPALDDPAFYAALSDRVSAETLTALDLETRVVTRLDQLDAFLSEAVVDAVDIDPQVRQTLQRFERPTLAALAPPITDALEGRVDATVDRLLTSDEFKGRFPTLVREAHEAGVALVRDDMAQLPNVYTADGEVRLNLVPIIRDALSQVVQQIRDFLPDVQLPDVVSNRVDLGIQQLGDALQAELPADFGQLTLMSQDSLGDVQQSVRTLDQLVWLLLAVTVAAIAGTLALSPDRRRGVIYLAVGILVGLALGTIAIRRVQAAVLAEVATPNGERVAAVLFNEAQASLRTIVLIIAAVAIVAAAAAHLAARPAWIGRLTRRGSELIARAPEGSRLDRWVFAHYDLLRVAGIAVALGILVITGIEIVPVLIVGVLLAGYLWALASAHQRQVAPGDSSPAGDERAPTLTAP